LSRFAIAVVISYLLHPPQSGDALFEGDCLDNAPLRLEDGGNVLGYSGRHRAFSNRAQERGMRCLQACGCAHFLGQLDLDRRAFGTGRLCR
jgi:hypothetical protein